MHSTATKLAVASLVMVVLSVIALAADMPLGEFFVNLLLGWGMFLKRVVFKLSVNWSAVATGGICLILIWSGLHLFLRWLSDAMQASGDVGETLRTAWKKRWTTAIIGVVVLMFVAGTSLIGVLHQTTWLATSPVPYVEERVSGYTWPSKDQLHQMSLATDFYHDIRQQLPHHHGLEKGRHSWMTAILPFSMVTVDGIDLDRDWDHPNNKPSFARVLPTYLNAEIAPFRNADGYAISHYAGNVHVLGNDRVKSYSDVTDGLAHTLLAGEVATNFKPWGDPDNLRDIARGLNNHADHFGGPSGGGAWLVRMDGSAKFYSKSTSPAVLNALAHPSDSKQP